MAFEKLTLIEKEVANMNLGKKIVYLAFGNVEKGYIHGASTRYGCFVYEVSKSKKPRVAFNLYKGSWSVVSPMFIIELIKEL